MHFCGRHTGRQVIYCIFFCQVCQYIKVQHSKIDFTFWRRHNNIFHESRSETKSGKMEHQMQLCSSRVDSGSVPSYLVIQGLQDRSDFNTTIVARRKRQFSGAGDNWRQLKGRRFVFFFRRKVERAWCALLDWLLRKWGLDLDFGSNWKQIWMQAQTQTSQRLEPFRKSLLRRDKCNQKQKQEHHNYQHRHCWISHKSASSGFVCVGNFLPNPLLCVTLVNLIEISTDRKHLLRSAPFRLRCQQTVNIFIPLFSSGVILTDHFCVSRF